MASNEPPSPRSWALFTTGVALASSAVTIVSVLGFQRLHRKRLRHDLEDDVKRATADREKASEKEGNVEDDRQTQGQPEQARPEPTSTPRYLAALAAAQEGTTNGSRAGSPRPTARPSAVAGPRGSVAAAGPSGVRPSLSTSSSGRKAAVIAGYDESLIREQLSRNYSFLGDEAMNSLRHSFVIVVGAGGVGSWCALMLLRSGVGRLRLIDFDQVSLSSLNRHACATLADVGRPKVQVCKEHFAEIAPWCDVDARIDIFRGNEAQRLLGPAKADSARKLTEVAPTYVVDCIDNLDTKVDLLAYCYHHKIPCFSSMGAGAKADPSQIQVADLNTTAEDPLARRVRRALRAKGVWGGGVMAKRNKTKGHIKAQNDGGRKAKHDGVDEDDASMNRKEVEHEAALQKLESGAGARSLKLEHSGRGVDEAQRANRRSIQTPSASRRASSNSSVGSGAYFSPLSSPIADGDAEKTDPTMQSFHLPEAVDVHSPSERNEGANGVDQSRVRPSLAMLQEPSSAVSVDQSPSRRTSSLKELAAEDIQSSFSGKIGQPGSEGVLTPHVEEDEEEVNEEENEKEQAGEKPYTIMCVYTNEKSDTRLLPLDEDEFQKGNVEELAALEDFRVRILPVLGPLPAMFGLAAATYIICDISGRQLEPLPFKGRRKTAERLWMDLETSERRYPSPGSKLSRAEMAIGPRRVPWTVEDVAYVFEEVYRCRSVVPPHETLTMGKILRWDSTLPLSVCTDRWQMRTVPLTRIFCMQQYSNVALFSKSDGQKHEEQVLKQGRSPVEVWGEEAMRMFKRRMAEERRMSVLR